MYYAICSEYCRMMPECGQDGMKKSSSSRLAAFFVKTYCHSSFLCDLPMNR